MGGATGDAVADRIIAALRGKPEGMNRTDLINLFGRNRRSTEIERVLAMLEKRGRVYRKKVDTGGRPAERWFVQ